MVSQKDSKGHSSYGFTKGFQKEKKNTSHWHCISLNLMYWFDNVWDMIEF